MKVILIIWVIILINFLGCGSGMIGLFPEKTPIPVIVDPPIDPPVDIQGLYNNDTGIFIGSIKAFTGNPDVISYYDYRDTTGHPSDVDMVLDEMNIMVYKNSTNYYLIFQINTDQNSPDIDRSASLNISISNNNINDYVILSDDAFEIVLASSDNEINNYVALWIWNKDGDGAVIGPLNNGATAIINFTEYNDLKDIKVLSKLITPYHLLNGSVATNIRIEFL